jgi:hypothetical protein
MLYAVEDVDAPKLILILVHYSSEDIAVHLEELAVSFREKGRQGCVLG